MRDWRLAVPLLFVALAIAFRAVVEESFVIASRAPIPFHSEHLE